MKLVLIGETSSGNEDVLGGVFNIETKYPQLATDGFQQQALLEELLTNLAEAKIIKDKIGMILPSLTEEEHEALIESPFEDNIGGPQDPCRGRTLG